MLSKANINLEPNYLKALSDPDLVTSIFAKGLQGTVRFSKAVEKVYMTRLYYREKAIILQYHVYFNNAESYEIFYGKLFNTSEEFNKYKEKLDNKYYFSIDEYKLVILFFPYDPKLKSLLKICSEDKNDFNFKDLLNADDCNYKILSHKVLGYRLERRAVLELQTDKEIKSCGNNKIFVMKLSKPSKSKLLYEKSKLLEHSGLDSSMHSALSTPKIYGFYEPDGVLLMEKVEGTTLHDLIGQDSFETGCVQAAKIIKKIHSVPIAGLGSFSIQQELKILFKQIEILQLISPGESKQFIEAYEILKDLLEVVQISSASQCIHRDFYDKQVIYSKARTTILDFDNLTAGDPALDYGNFVAHLYLRSCQSPEHAGQIMKGEQSFIKEYDADDQFLKRVNWWRSTTLLRLATIYYYRPRWRELTIHLLRKSINSLGN